MIYAAAGGGGSSAGTLADPATIPRAVTLARAAIAAGGGRQQIVLRGHVVGTAWGSGTIRPGATVALTAADTIDFSAYPGEIPFWSGGAVVSGWTDDGSGQGVFVATYAGPQVRECWANGMRVQRARGAVYTGGQLTDIAGGFTLPDTSLSGAVGVELCGPRSWAWMQVPGTISGNTFTADATAWTNAQSQAGGSFTVAGGGAIFAENARVFLTSSTLGHFFHDTSAGKLYWKPQPWDDISTTLFVVGVVATLVTVTGTGASPAAITFTGITFCETGWAPSHGYQDVQGPLIGYAGGVSGTGPQRLAAMVASQVPAAVYVTYADASTSFTRCEAARTAAGGIAFGPGSQSVGLSRIYFRDCGAYAAALGNAASALDWSPATSADRVLGLVLTDSTLINTGVTYHGCPAVYLGYTSASGALRCASLHNPSAHFASGWGFGIVLMTPPPWQDGLAFRQLYTYGKPLITGTSTVMVDLGAFYALAACYSGGTVSGCYIDDTVNSGHYGVSYFDTGAQNWTVSGCVCRSGSSAPGVHINQAGAGGAVTSNIMSTGNYATVASDGSGSPGWSESGFSSTVFGMAQTAILVATGPAP